jgi:hypothetical protein
MNVVTLAAAAIVAVATYNAPCREYPQFPNYARVKALYAEAQQDKADIGEVLKHFGCWYDDDGLRWRDVPRYLEHVRLRWYEADRIAEIYGELADLTWDGWHDGHTNFGPFALWNLEAHVRRQLGDEWFDEGLMPVPLNRQGRSFRLVPVEPPDA